jgi:hypothetical protein
MALLLLIDAPPRVNVTRLLHARVSGAVHPLVEAMNAWIAGDAGGRCAGVNLITMAFTHFLLFCCFIISLSFAVPQLG